MELPGPHEGSEERRVALGVGEEATGGCKIEDGDRVGEGRALDDSLDDALGGGEQAAFDEPVCKEEAEGLVVGGRRVGFDWDGESACGGSAIGRKGRDFGGKSVPFGD